MSKWKNILKMNPSLVVDKIGEHKDILADSEEMFRLYADNKMVDEKEFETLFEDYDINHNRIKDAMKTITGNLSRS